MIIEIMTMLMVGCQEWTTLMVGDPGWNRAGGTRFHQATQNSVQFKTYELLDFPGGGVVKNPPASAGDTGSSPGPGRSHLLQSN